MVSFNVFSQDDPVSWTFESETIDDITTVISLKAKIDKGWFIYSQHTDAGGPIPTSIELTASTNGDLIGEFEEKGEMILQYNELFEVDVMKFKDQVDFVKHMDKIETDLLVTGSIIYMACDSEKCLPPKTIEFEIN